MLNERLTKNVQKILKKENPDIILEILNEIKSLCTNPIKGNSLRCKESEFSESIFSINCYNYKILYEVNFKEGIVLIHDLEKEDRFFERK